MRTKSLFATFIGLMALLLGILFSANAADGEKIYLPVVSRSIPPTPTPLPGSGIYDFV